MDHYAFHSIMEEVSRQKERMDHLETENRALRQQLVDLRAGHGILVEIAGRRFALAPHLVSQEQTTRLLR